MVVSNCRILGTESLSRRVARSQIVGLLLGKLVVASVFGKVLLGSQLGGVIGAGGALLAIGYFLYEPESGLRLADPKADSVWSGVTRVFRQCVNQFAPKEALRLEDFGSSLEYPVTLKVLSNRTRGSDFGVWRGLFRKKTVIAVSYSAANTLTERELLEVFQTALLESQKPDLAWECLYLRAVSVIAWVSGSDQMPFLIRSSGPMHFTQTGLPPFKALRLAYGLFLLEALDRLWFTHADRALPRARRILVKSPLSAFLKAG